MKKILVLASLLVSLSFGLDEFNHFYTLRFLDLVKAGKLPLGKPCKKVQDKVDGCFVMTERKDGGIDQVVVYHKKKILSFHRIFKTPYSPLETEWIFCARENDSVEDTKMKCAYRAGDNMAGEREGKEIEGDAKELIKKYVKQ